MAACAAADNRLQPGLNDEFQIRLPKKFAAMISGIAMGPSRMPAATAIPFSGFQGVDLMSTVSKTFE